VAWVLKKLTTLFFIVLNLNGCASISRSITEPGEAKQKFKFSYVQALVMVQGALKSEQIQFEKAIISKDVVKLKGNYSNGRTIQITILKVTNFESILVVRAGALQAGNEAAKNILEAIVKYSKLSKQ
jgi:hypothetical protein